MPLCFYLAGFGAGTPQQDRVCEATNAPAGRLSGSPVLRSKIEGPRPDKGYFKMRECRRSAVPEERNIFKN